jgi:hypothetical protein
VLRRHPKGRFLYRLAGRDREKSASYYTPEVLTRSLVKYALKELYAEQLDAAAGRRRPRRVRAGRAHLRTGHGLRGVHQRGHRPARRQVPRTRAERPRRAHPPGRLRAREAAREDVHRRPQRLRRRPEPGRGRTGRGVAVARRALRRPPRALVRPATARRQLADRRTPRDLPGQQPRAEAEGRRLLAEPRPGPHAARPAAPRGPHLALPAARLRHGQLHRQGREDPLPRGDPGHQRLAQGLHPPVRPRTARAPRTPERAHRRPLAPTREEPRRPAPPHHRPVPHLRPRREGGTLAAALQGPGARRRTLRRVPEKRHRLPPPESW